MSHFCDHRTEEERDTVAQNVKGMLHDQAKASSEANQINKLTLHHPQFEHVIATHQKHSGIGHGFPSSLGRAELLAAKKCTTLQNDRPKMTQVTTVPLTNVRHAKTQLQFKRHFTHSFSAVHPHDQPTSNESKHNGMNADCPCNTR